VAGTIIKLRRTTTANAPSNLNAGELAYVYNVGGNIRSTNGGNRLYIGDPSSPSNNPILVGGAYYVNLLQHTPGTLVTDTLTTLNIDGGAVVTDAGGYIDQLLVGDNTNKGIRIQGSSVSTISTTRANTDLTIDPNGTGNFVFTGGTSQSFLINNGSVGTNRFTVDSTTGNTSISGTLGVSGVTSLTNATDSTTTGTGGLVVSGGVGIALQLRVGGNTTLTGLLTANGGAQIDNIRIGIASDNTIDTSTGNLTLDSTGGTTTINDNAVVSGTLDVSGLTKIKGANLSVTSDAGGTTPVFTANASTGITYISSLNVDSTVATTVTSGSVNLFNTGLTGTLNVAGSAGTINIGSSTSLVNFGKLGVVGNTIYNTDTNATSIVLDPYPSAGESGGNLIVRGNLTVTGTTTTVNSTSISVNEPIIILGDAVTSKTVVAAATNGATVIQLDNVTDLSVGTSVQSGGAIASGTTLTAVTVEFNVGSTTGFSAGSQVWDGSVTPRQRIGTVAAGGIGANKIKVDVASNYKVREYSYYSNVAIYTAVTGGSTVTISSTAVNASFITLNNGITTGIPASTNASVQELTFTQATDDAFDRGVQFNYVSSNVSKTGFFGFRKNTNDFAFIPDATFNNNVASGTIGNIAINTLTLSTALTVPNGGTGATSFTSKGIIYGNNGNALQVTAAANMASPGTGTDVTDSYQILTVTAAGVPVWTSTIDGGTY
jgi:hypothetical protein